MALPFVDISFLDVRAILGIPNFDLTSLCTSDAINKWSRYKPVRGVGPACVNGLFGFNLPASWDYLKERGRAVSLDENYETNEFGGYEHDRDVAGPVVFCRTSDVNLLSVYTPTIGNTQQGYWTLHMNTSHDNVRIVPADLGMQNYYWGMNVGGYYKTLGSVLADNATLLFNMQLDLSNPASPSFGDLPYLTGTVNWELFVSAETRLSWSTSRPAGYVKLPGDSGETWGSKTIKSSGSFTIADWITGTIQSAGWQYSEGGYSYYKSFNIACSTGTWHIAQIPSGFSIRNAGGGLLSVGSSGSTGDELRIYPTTSNGGASAITGEFIFHDANNNPFTFEVVQSANAAPVSVFVGDGGVDTNVTIWDGSGNVPIGATLIDLLVVGSRAGYSEGQQFLVTYSIERNGYNVGSGSITLKSSQGTPTTPHPQVYMSEAAQAGDTIIVNLNV